MTTAVDLRIFHNASALGLLNAMAGYFYVDPNVRYLVDQPWMGDFLRRQKIPDGHIVPICAPRDLIALRGWTIILPLQRSRLDIIMLRLLGLITLKTFVHDFHFLSRRPLLAMEFKGRAAAIKRVIYLLVIRYADEILVDSRLVQRQVRRLFRRDSTLTRLKRIFVHDDLVSTASDRPRSVDYFIPLSGRKYKGAWALDRLQFENPFSRVLVDSSHVEEVQRLIRPKNPHVEILHRNLRPEAALIGAFKDARTTLCLSRHEGFGFVPYEAAFFGSTPVVLNCTTYIEVSRDAFVKLPLDNPINVPPADKLAPSIASQMLARQHVVLC